MVYVVPVAPVMFTPFFLHCNVVVPVTAGTLDVSVTVAVPHNKVFPDALTTGVDATTPSITEKPALINPIHPVVGFVTCTVYVPATEAV